MIGIYRCLVAEAERRRLASEVVDQSRLGGGFSSKLSDRDSRSSENAPALRSQPPVATEHQAKKPTEHDGRYGTSDGLVRYRL